MSQADAEDIIIYQGYDGVEWPESRASGARGPLVCMVQAMYDAVRLDCLLFASSGKIEPPEPLDEDVAAVWCRAMPDEANLAKFSWNSLAWSVGELPVASDLNDHSDFTHRRDLLDWYTMRVLQYVGQHGYKLEPATMLEFDAIVRKHLVYLGRGLRDTPSHQFLKTGVKVVKVLYRMHFPSSASLATYGAALLHFVHVRHLWYNTDRLMNVYGCNALQTYPPNDHPAHDHIQYDGGIEQCLQDCFDAIAENKNMHPNDATLTAVFASCQARTNFWPAVNEMFSLLDEDSLVAFHYDVLRGVCKILRLFHRIIVYEAQDKAAPTMAMVSLELFAMTFFIALKDEAGFSWDALWRANFEPHTPVIVRWFLTILGREIERWERIEQTVEGGDVKKWIVALGDVLQGVGGEQPDEKLVDRTVWVAERLVEGEGRFRLDALEVENAVQLWNEYVNLDEV
tara:strand:- start:8220 stop:9584 length:1365 start_codon:yes stop_codon:yes gene_type:complete